MAEQFKAVGGGEFKIPFMADNIGGFKINGTVVAGPRLASSGGVLQPSFRNSYNRDFNPAVRCGPYNNCGVPGAKSYHLLSPTYGSAAGLL
jgi:hypothetical protein